MTNRPRYRHPRIRKFRGGGVLRDHGSVPWTTALIFCGTIVAAVVLAVLTPYVLGAVGGPTQFWERLSFIATVVGAAFTMAAVVGIAVGVVNLRRSAEAQELQAKAHRAAVEQATFTEHRELERIGMDRPHLNAAWGGPADPRLSDDDSEAQTYANLIMGFWQMTFRFGAIGETEVRHAARRFFTGRIGRAYWKTARRDRAETALDDTERRFHELVDAEYQAALRTPPAPDEPLAPSPLAAGRPGPPTPSPATAALREPVRGRRERAVAAGAVAVAVTGVAGYLLGRHGGR